MDVTCTLSATELAAKIRRKEISPVEVVDAILAHVEQVNPALNAIVTVTADLARSTARAAEQAVMDGDALGPLHGVPFTLKDLTPTRGIRTTMGSKLFEHNVPTVDSLVYERLRDAGGIMIGKTNTPDHGCKGVTDNAVFGATSNPWELSRTSGGSSGGAAAAVAAGMGPLAEGSDFAGSIRIPAGFCGLVGHKPSDGRIPNVPNSMIWHAVASTHGPLARTVADAALMLQVMAGPDARDPRSLADGPYDFVATVASDLAIRQLRVGYSADLGFVPIEADVAQICRAAADHFERLGCVVDEIDADFSDSVEPYSLLNANRRAALMSRFYPDRKDEMDPLMAWRTEVSNAKTATDAAQAETAQAAIYRRVHDLFTRYDVLLVPSTPVPPFPLGVDYPTEIAGVAIPDPFYQLPLTSLFNMTGHPAVSVPAGWTADGLPVGIQIIGPWRDDERVLRVAAAFEQAAPWRHRWPTLVAGHRAAS